MTDLTATIPYEASPRNGGNIVAVASGKGGVGKTFFAITLSHALARAGQRVLLFDGDLGMANVDVQLGLDPAVDLTRAIARNLPIAEAAQSVDGDGFTVIAGRSGSGALGTLTPRQAGTLGRAVGQLAPDYDRVILDLAAGLDGTVRALATHAGTSIVVVNDEPTSLTDAYAFIKVTKHKRPNTDLRIVVNQARTERDGERTYTALRKACETFLRLDVPLLGIVRRDPWVSESIRRQTPLLTRNPNAPAAQDVEAIAARLPALEQA